MSYISHAQLAERPGARELAQVATAAHKPMVDPELMEATLLGGDRAGWTPDQVALADDALQRIDDATADAQALIDGFLSRRGYLPLDPVPGIVVTWARAITRYHLHQNRLGDDSDDPIVRDYKDAVRFLQLTADGKFSLGQNDPVESDPAHLDVQFESDPNVFSRDQLKRFR